MHLRETNNLEFKSEVTNSFLKTVSAFANYGNGVIVFGVLDNGDIKGLEDLEQQCLNIENKINDNIFPVPRYHLNIDFKVRTITLSVEEGGYKPYLYHNKAYKRNDSATIAVDRLEFGRLILEGAHQNYEELPASQQDLHFADLEAQLVEHLSIQKLSTDILKTLNLYSNQEGYNRAAELLADENTVVILDIARFGKNINEFVERIIVEKCSILKAYAQAIEVYRRYYQYEVIEGDRRRVMETIPEEAFREALANSLVHRTWDVAGPIKIAMDQKQIEIVSPGGLPPGITKEEYLQGQISNLRNPIISNVFFRLGIIEGFGTGIRRINFSYENSVIKPEYQIFANSITVVLPLYRADIEFQDDQSLRLYNLLKKNGAMSRRELEDASGLVKDKIIRLLNPMIQDKLVERIGRGKGTKYRVV